MEDYEIFITSVYFAVTTIVTVGYGDISPVNAGEKIICILLMLIGVVSFSVGTGALSSIISNYDSTLAKLQEKMASLQNIKVEYNLEPDLFKKLTKSVRFNHIKKSRDFYLFMEELPYKLKVELAMQIHKKIYHTIIFLKDQDKNFIGWIGTMLRPVYIQEQEFIFQEGEEIMESKILSSLSNLVYFLIYGVGAYVLPRYDNIVYIKITEGDHFGHTDMIQDKKSLERDILSRRKVLLGKDLLRMFSVQALTNCDLLILSLHELEKIKIEFLDIFIELFTTALLRQKKELKIKDKSILLVEKELHEIN